MDTNLQNITILKQNITVAYESLNLQTIDTSKLKSLLKKVAPMVMDTPEMIVAIYPIGPLIIQFADNRIRITLQKETQDFKNIGIDNGIHLWKVMLETHRLVNEPKLSAYGFNYDIGAVVNSNIQTLIKDVFMFNTEQIEIALNANQIIFLPRVKFERNQIVYDLIFEPINDQRIVTHLNVHFETNTFPNQETLRQSFREQFNYLIGVHSNLFEKRNEQ